MKPKKHPGGRPTKYKPEYARMAQLCIEDSGFSMYKLAKLFNVDRATVYRWLEAEKEFRDGVDQGRNTWEGLKIHDSLVKKAVGFTYTERTQELDLTGKMRLTKKVRKYYPPDVAAIKHWQVNRDPERWKDKQDIDLKVKLDEVLAALPGEYSGAVRAALAKTLRKE